jgi:hypothetical protein
MIRSIADPSRNSGVREARKGFSGRFSVCYICWTFCALVVVESASGDLVVKEDAMIFAIPILIAVTFFLGWLLVKLTIHALPIFTGISAAVLAHQASAGPVTAIAIGALAAIAIAAIARVAFECARSPALRLAVPLAFAMPASIAAYHAALGLSALVMPDGFWRAAVAMAAAALIGAAAWREIMSSRTGRGAAASIAQ